MVVLGLARSGETAARALLERGAVVRVLDALDGDDQRARAARIAGAECVLGRVEPADLDGDLVVTSPGVPPASPWLAAARARGIPVWSEVELAFRLGARPAVAVTGTKGKTTTVEMTIAALAAAGMPAVAAGNIGAPLVQADPDPIIVAEVSSAQLWGIDRFRTGIAVLTNLAPDHLDWHGSFDAYLGAKSRLFVNQRPDDTTIFRDDRACRALVGERARQVPFADDALPRDGAGIADGWVVVPAGRVVAVDLLRARNRPHRAAAVAAAATACALGADPAAVGAGLAAYEPRPHRIETVETIDGVTYVNDSKATDPYATLAALEDLDRVVLIAGGRNKGLDLGELSIAAPKLKAVVVIGEAAKELETAFSGLVPVHVADSMTDAVSTARALALPGDTVLLSPACSSWDMFHDYEERGEAFRAVVLRGGNR